jgi:hypothetical protein
MNTSKSIQNLLYLVSGTVVLAWISVLLWASNRGFDITDEGFYMYKYSDLNTSKVSYTNFHLIQKFLFPFIEPTVQNLRIEKLLLCIAGAAAFTAAIEGYCRQVLQVIIQKRETILLGILIFSGFTLTYAFGPQTPAYNFFSSFFITLASSLFIIDISKKHETRWVILIYLLIGALCQLLFQVKFSNAIIAAFVFIDFYLLYNLIALPNKLAVIKQTFLRLVLMLTGFFIFHVLFCGGFEAALEFSKRQVSGITELKGYDSDVLIDTYLSTFTTVFDSLCTLKFILVCLSLAGIVYGQVKNNQYVFYSSIILQVLAIFRFKLYYGGEANKTEQTIIYLLWIIAFLVIFLIQQKRNNSANRPVQLQRILFALFLFFIPFAGALGTNNKLHIQVIFYIPFWMALLYIQAINSRLQEKMVTVVTFLSVLAMLQSLDSVLNHPYRINGGLFAQNESSTIGKENLMIDKACSESIAAIDSVLKVSNIKDNDYLFCFSDLAGLGYVLYQPIIPHGNGWFNPGDIEHNCSLLKKLHKAEPHSRVIFILDSRYPAQSDSLVKYWTELKNNPESYIKTAEIRVSFSNDPHNLSIYVPR